jgi:chromosome segregation ATPase
MGVLGAGSLAGCHKTAAGEVSEAALNEASVKRSLDGLQSQLGQLEAKFAVLRKQVEAVSPDLPGLSQVRALFYSTEEARGITDVKVKLIANRLASASGSRRPEELRQISKDIAETHDEVRQIDELHASLSSRARALQRAGGAESDTAPRAGSAPPIAKTTR